MAGAQAAAWAGRRCPPPPLKGEADHGETNKREKKLVSFFLSFFLSV